MSHIRHRGVTNRRPKARWIGIDEAGYGPNLGPLVMTAVVAESAEDRPPDLWRDLEPKIQRAGAAGTALWIDDSKAVYKAGQGRERLEAACLALLESLGEPMPKSLEGFFCGDHRDESYRTC